MCIAIKKVLFCHFFSVRHTYTCTQPFCSSFHIEMSTQTFVFVCDEDKVFLINFIWTTRMMHSSVYFGFAAILLCFDPFWFAANGMDDVIKQNETTHNQYDCNFEYRRKSKNGNKSETKKKTKIQIAIERKWERNKNSDRFKLLSSFLLAFFVHCCTDVQIELRTTTSLSTQPTHILVACTVLNVAEKERKGEKERETERRRVIKSEKASGKREKTMNTTDASGWKSF